MKRFLHARQKQIAMTTSLPEETANDEYLPKSLLAMPDAIGRSLNRAGEIVG